MRNIIFRGRSISHHGKKEEWVYGFYSNYKGVNGRTHYISDDNGNSIAVRGETVGQYTGLTDKNENRIFEGDIVSLESIKSRINKVVCWNEERATYDVVDCGKSRMELYAFFRCEIIGNIHDNPELLYECQR